jgi:hypothetical protein
MRNLLNPTGKDPVMKSLGRIYPLLLIFLFTAGTAVSQTDPVEENVEENTGQTESEVGQVSTEKSSRSPHNKPFGVRAGYTHWKNVDQFHFGGHVYLGELWPNVIFTPNVEVGLGDDVFIMTINGDIAYLFTEFVSHPWGLYGGGSLSFNLVDPSDAKADTDLGLSGLVGTTYTFANDHRGMAEFRFGIMDSPAIKVTFGYTLF